MGGMADMQESLDITPEAVSQAAEAIINAKPAYRDLIAAGPNRPCARMARTMAHSLVDYLNPEPRDLSSYKKQGGGTRPLPLAMLTPSYATPAVRRDP